MTKSAFNDDLGHKFPFARDMIFEPSPEDMIEQLLFTRPGERVNRPDFGSGLMQLVFAPNSPELAACAIGGSDFHWTDLGQWEAFARNEIDHFNRPPCRSVEKAGETE